MTGFSSSACQRTQASCSSARPSSRGPAPVISVTAITVSSAAIGNLPISYQWQSGGASGSLTNVPNATNATLIVTPPNTGTYRYDYIATDSSGSITSGVATATIIVGTPTVSPSNTVYIGSPITLTSPSGVGNPPLGYQWQSGGASGSLTNVPNATNASFTVTPPGTGTFRYRLHSQQRLRKFHQQRGHRDRSGTRHRDPQHDPNDGDDAFGRAGGRQRGL